ncbi:MAG: hypothetical protein HQM09_17535 [Candidatus Riflebacteria bacterium]|nr:hypothetical protein [Candidatus Riflebacteria bacterium]
MDIENVKDLIAMTFILSIAYMCLVYSPLYIFTILCTRIAQYIVYGDDMDDPFQGGGFNP